MQAIPHPNDATDEIWFLFFHPPPPKNICIF